MREPDVSHAGAKWMQALVFGVAYMLLAGICDVLFRFGEDAIAIFWVPSALTLAVFLRTPTRRWPALAGALFVGAALEVLWLRHPPAVALGWAFAVTLEPITGATILRQMLHVRPALLRARDVFVLIAFGGLIAPMVGGVFGATVASELLGRSWISSWMHWWTSAGVGVALFAPLFLIAGKPSLPPWTRWRRAELALLIALTFVLAGIWSRIPLGSVLAVPLAASVTLPMLAWGALRFGVKGTAAVSVTLALTASWNAALGFGPFLGATGESEFIATQAFFAIMSVGGLALAATLNARLRAEAGQRLLADVGVLLASEHDELAALRSVADRLVPELARGCAIALVRDGQTPKPVVARHVRPELEDALSAAAGFVPPAPLRFGWLGRGAGRALVSSGFPERALTALRPASLLALPLRANGKANGTLLLVDGAPDGCFDEGQQLLADEVARRCSMALESARLRREQEKAIRSRDDFLSIASHELKTPLTPLVLQLARMARRVEAGGQVNPEWIARARSSARRLSELIDDLLDAGKIASGRLALHLEPIPLEPMLRELTATFGSASPRHTLALRLPEQPVWVSGDRFRLEQVFANLLDNGIKYSPLGGTITVSLEVEGERAVMSVADQGIGIPADQQEHLFDRFFRARNSPSQLFGGLGLGLFICRDIIQRHGGEISVESTPGEGSTFRVELPVFKGLSPETGEKRVEPSMPADLQ